VVTGEFTTGADAGDAGDGSENDRLVASSMGVSYPDPHPDPPMRPDMEWEVNRRVGARPGRGAVVMVVVGISGHGG
jgi:hypothetical protein